MNRHIARLVGESFRNRKSFNGNGRAAGRRGLHKAERRAGRALCRAVDG